jgi:hypothetical protein
VAVRPPLRVSHRVAVRPLVAVRQAHAGAFSYLITRR